LDQRYMVTSASRQEVPMRSTMVAAACVIEAFCLGCQTSSPAPSLSITPSGTVQISGPTDFSAGLGATTAGRTWRLTGGGTLSTTTGLHVVFAPPAGTATETLTAMTSSGLSASVEIHSSPATLTGAKIPGLTAPVTVEYDAQDVPHITCAATIDCIAVQ